MRRLIMAVLLVSCSMPERVLAQVEETDGLRVRVTTMANSIFIGYLRNLSDEDLTIQADSEETMQVILLGEIAEVERSLGLRRSVGKRFAAVFIGTIAVTGLFAAARWSPCTESNTYSDSYFGPCFLYPKSRVGALFFGMAAGGIVGLPLGLVVGLSGPKRERWEPLVLPEPSAVAFSIRPAARFYRGLSLGVAISARIVR